MPLAPEYQALLAQLAETPGPPFTEMTPEEGRAAYRLMRPANPEIAVGQVLQLPGGSRTARAGAASAGVYVVRRGDNLQSIAARFDTTAAALAEHNGLRNRNRIQVGQRLYLPGSARP